MNGNRRNGNPFGPATPFEVGADQFQHPGPYQAPPSESQRPSGPSKKKGVSASVLPEIMEVVLLWADGCLRAAAKAGYLLNFPARILICVTGGDWSAPTPRVVQWDDLFMSGVISVLGAIGAHSYAVTASALLVASSGITLPAWGAWAAGLALSLLSSRIQAQFMRLATAPRMRNLAVLASRAKKLPKDEKAISGAQQLISIFNRSGQAIAPIYLLMFASAIAADIAAVSMALSLAATVPVPWFASLLASVLQTFGFEVAILLDESNRAGRQTW